MSELRERLRYWRYQKRLRYVWRGEVRNGFSLTLPCWMVGHARIIEGATCHQVWSDWNGLKAPESEPVLSLLGGNEHWQRTKPLVGQGLRLQNVSNQRQQEHRHNRGNIR
ncbi:MAG: hypothetical protein IH921_14020 [Gemmatimonadetes bacterium]|nr:hypothetical protein [Gemmatimonadota bacterium]